MSDGDPSAHAPARRAGAEIYERLKQDILTFVFRPERAGELADIDALQYGWLEGYSAQTAPLDGSYVVPDERFHLALARATGNAYLLESMERVHDAYSGRG